MVIGCLDSRQVPKAKRRRSGQSDIGPSSVPVQSWSNMSRRISPPLGNGSMTVRSSPASLAEPSNATSMLIAATTEARRENRKPASSTQLDTGRRLAGCSASDASSIAPPERYANPVQITENGGRDASAAVARATASRRPRPVLQRALLRRRGSGCSPTPAGRRRAGRAVGTTYRQAPGVRSP